jgi:purine-binding chemotaxis protein CheW
MTDVMELLEGSLDLGDIGSPDDESEEIKPLTILTFKIGSQVFAVNVHLVREILDMSEINPLPNAPHDVLGMIDLRGQSIAIVDLASRIGACSEGRQDQRIIVFEFPNGDRMTSLGVLADRVLRVRETSEEAIEPVPETLSGWRCDVADGMVRSDDGIAIMLGMDRILGGSGQPGPFDFS